MKLSFTKMQGCANDYIYLDCRTSGVPEEIAALSERLSRRHFSIGADGIICICAPVTAGADAMMRIFNADGSEGKMCGNGIRCVAEWLYTHGMAKPKLAIDTLSGLKTVARMGEGLWQVEMGAYTAMAAALPAVNMGEGPLVDLPLEVEENLWRVTCISVGNPHCVTIVPEVDSLKLEQIGPGFEHHENFPERINTEFVQVVDATHLKMRVWERGSGETWACGTGTCATVAALTELGICPAGEDVHVQLRGGELTIRVLPGITAASTAAAALGAPLQNGFSLVSLSDLLVPADEVRRNLRAVAQSALPVTLYNPAGRKRRRLLAEALDIFREARGGDILCAFVRHAGRPEETRWIGRLADLPADDVDMSTLVLIGSARTVTDRGALFEARGYAEKYLDKDAPASTADGR